LADRLLRSDPGQFQPRAAGLRVSRAVQADPAPVQKSPGMFGVRVTLGLIIVLTEILFLRYFAALGIEFILSSALMSIAILVQLRFGIRQDAATPADLTVFIFDWLFLDFAPKIQLLYEPQQLVNTSSVSVGTVATTNLVCAIFILTFTAVYYFMSVRLPRSAPAVPAEDKPMRPIQSGAIGIAVLACVMVVGLAAPYAYHHAADPATATTPGALVLSRVLLFLPAATLLIVLNETVRSGRRLKFSRVCVIGLLLLLVLIDENPYTEKRNALGPIYMGFLLICFQRWFAVGGRRLWLLLSGMAIVFPVISLFTVHDKTQSFSDISMADLLAELQAHYLSVNYDSWANVYTSIEIVRTHALQWGHQVLGSLLFFVPSALWTTKPLATGIFLANYLISNYSMWFTNLSAPLVAEGYLDFGYLGVIGYAALLAASLVRLNKFAARMDSWSAFPIGVYYAVFLMIILRGSLMIALAFTVAAYVSFRLASAMLSVNIMLVRRRFEDTRSSDDRTLAA
jgi:hypothetical protein